MDIKEINGDQLRSIENKGVASRSLGSSYLELLLAAQQRAHARSDLELVEQLWGKEGGEGRGRRDEHLHAGRVADLELWQSPVRTSARSSRCARVIRRQSEAITGENERKIISVREGHQKAIRGNHLWERAEDHLGADLGVAACDDTIHNRAQRCPRVGHDAVLG